MTGRRSAGEDPFPLLINSSNITRRRRATDHGVPSNNISSTKIQQLLSNFDINDSPGNMSSSSNNGIDNLNDGLNCMSMMSKFALKQAEYLKKGGNSMNKWTSKNDNVALDDVMGKSNEIYAIFSERLVQFAKEHETSIQGLKKIEETEKSIKNAEKRLNNIIEQEKKMEKDIKKYGRSSSSSFFRTSKKQSDINVMHHELKQIRNAKIIAQKELSDIKVEMEVVKMFRFRKGMEGVAVAWRNLAMDIASIFTSQQELVDNVPAVSTEDVREMVYDGRRQTRIIVEDLKEKLRITNPSNENGTRIYGRRSEPIPVSSELLSESNRRGTPPPPYSMASAPPPSVNRDLPRVTNRCTFLSPSNSEDSDYSSSSNCSDNNISFDRTPIRIPIPPPPTTPEHVSGDRLYPSLPPNPYKEQLRLRNNYNEGHTRSVNFSNHVTEA
uniref:IMD domain-containing protein n=1 Tax=Parastrongyloides trichosuri TaxID=131310 RepID=A0A0N4ZI58_PARTI